MSKKERGRINVSIFFRFFAILIKKKFSKPPRKRAGTAYRGFKLSQDSKVSICVVFDIIASAGAINIRYRNRIARFVSPLLFEANASLAGMIKIVEASAPNARIAKR